MQTYNTTYFSKAPLFTFIYGTKLMKKSTDLFFSRIGIEHFLIVSLYSKILSLNLGRFGRITKNVILSSDKRVIMKIITSAQVMYYFTSAKHEWNNTLRVHKWLFSLSRVYQTTITLSYYLFNNCFKYNFHYLRGW